MTKQTIKVKGMTCGHCKASVEGALTKLAGVTQAEVNLENKEVTVEYNEDEVTIDQLKSEIEDTGFDVVA
ncbi:copper chaperone CopZ [Alkalihalobacterium elongatum]|uniref:copper chaperone CopZ n=1 Tax=Alkalihalobacterium elongatum TaxID=2675466 RepID=UPI001C1F39DF|nr:copper chaperone CopZ [Alkalihalobacterium elongatum]